MPEPRVFVNPLDAGHLPTVHLWETSEPRPRFPTSVVTTDLGIPEGAIRWPGRRSETAGNRRNGVRSQGMNRLGASTSPYLLQHADNPVHWYEWGAEAFGAAAGRNVPVLLSVGYSACHWCHVMAHESFEDPETAEIMNELFVNIKVDREERPDVDAVYMEATQAMTGHGGWPMTVWLDHDGAPFYAGTYFPKSARHGMPSFVSVMQAVSEAWHGRRSDVAAQASNLVAAISRTLPASPVRPTRQTVDRAIDQILAGADHHHGGFGGAPKFPQAPVLDLLVRSGREDARSVLESTLVAMARGGIYDQVGGGFSRYTVDEAWQVPHFEKMLYDNAQLARVYLWAWRATGNDNFRTIARETLDYLVRDLSDRGGGFFSAEDADSEGEEGKFYIWSLDDFEATVPPPDRDVAAMVWGITASGNFEGSNILHVEHTTASVAARLDLSHDEVLASMDRARAALAAARGQRIRPGLDDKVVASWNGLALRAFAEASVVLDDDEYRDVAASCGRFLIEEMRLPDGRYSRTWTGGRRGVDGFLEDQAAISLGLWSLYAVTGDPAWYRHALDAVLAIPEHFTDPAGGFFSTADGAEDLIKRPKDQMDNPLPSGNTMAAEALLVGSAYTGDAHLAELATRTVDAGGMLIERYPSAVGGLLGTVDTMARGMAELAISGPDPQPLLDVYWDDYRPHVVLAVDADGRGADAVPLLEGRFSPSITRAFVCRGFVCDAPVTTPDELRDALTSTSEWAS